jgi:transcriptional regulator with XRE-family HTH domain
MSTQPPLHRSLGTELQRHRVALGLTQAALAEKVAACGDWTIRQSDISRLERGVVTLPHAPRLRFLAAALGVPAGDLLVSSGWTGSTELLASFTEEATTTTESNTRTERVVHREEPLLEKRSSPEEMARTLEQVLQDLAAVRQTLERVSLTTSRLLAEIELSANTPQDPS